MGRRLAAWVLLAVPGMVAAVVAVASCSSTKAPTGLGAGCSLNSECNGALICSFGLCHIACATSKDCSGGATCLVPGECELPQESMCSSTLPCVTGLVCASDSCNAPCTAGVPTNSPGGCLPDQTCTSATVAAAPEAVCLDNGDGGAPGDGSTSGDGGGGDGSSGGDGMATDAPSGSPDASSDVTAPAKFSFTAQGDSNPSFTSGVGVRTANTFLIFSGYAGGRRRHWTTSSTFRHSIRQRRTRRAPRHPSSPRPPAPASCSRAHRSLPRETSRSRLATADCSATMGHAAAWANGVPFMRRFSERRPTQARRAWVLREPWRSRPPESTANRTSSGRCLPAHSCSLGRPGWAAAAGHLPTRSFGRTDRWRAVRIRVPTTVGPPCCGYDIGSVAAGPTLLAVATGGWLTIFDPSGAQVGDSSAGPFNPGGNSLWETVAATAQGFVYLVDQGGVLERFIPTLGASVALPDNDAAAVAGFTFAGGVRAWNGHAISDDTGGLGGVGVALLYPDGLSLAYVSADGTTHSGPLSVIAHTYVNGDQINITNFGGSFGLSLYSAASQSTQMAASE